MVAVQPGDILAFGGSKDESLASRLVEAAELLKTGDDSRIHFSHAAIVEDGVYMIQAVWPFIKRSPIPWERTFLVLRRPELITADVLRITDYARGMLGHPYNLLYVLLGGWAHAKIKGTEVCSLLVQDSYAAARKFIDGSTPDRIVYNSSLTLAGHWRPDHGHPAT